MRLIHFYICQPGEVVLGADATRTVDQHVEDLGGHGKAEPADEITLPVNPTPVQGLL